MLRKTIDRDMVLKEISRDEPFNLGEEYKINENDDDECFVFEIMSYRKAFETLLEEMEKEMFLFGCNHLQVMEYERAYIDGRYWGVKMVDNCIDIRRQLSDVNVMAKNETYGGYSFVESYRFDEFKSFGSICSGEVILL